MTAVGATMLGEEKDLGQMRVFKALRGFNALTALNGGDTLRAL